MLAARSKSEQTWNTFFAERFRRPLLEVFCAFTISFSYWGLRAHVRRAECRRKNRQWLRTGQLQSEGECIGKSALLSNSKFGLATFEKQG
jgi:hypothetical protein